MNWDDVRVFLAVARAGQILGAAKRLDLNHATVARRIGALEAALGTKLFRRQTTGSDLTEAGARFLETAERTEAEMLAAAASLAGEGESVTGTVRIGAPDGFGTAFLAPRLKGLTDAHPQLTAQLVPVPRSFSLPRREADIAITTERPAEGRLVAAKLTDYSLGLYASRDYTASNGLPHDAADLRTHKLVGYVPDLLASPSLDYAADFAPEWNARLAVSSALGQVEAVRSGAGIGILHAFIARTHADLVPVEAVKPIRRAYWIVFHESVRHARTVQATAAFVGASVEAERDLFL